MSHWFFLLSDYDLSCFAFPQGPQSCSPSTLDTQLQVSRFLAVPVRVTWASEWGDWPFPHPPLCAPRHLMNYSS